MVDLARAEKLVNLSLDYRVALAHSPIQPQHVHQVKAGWVRDNETEISYGFVLSYRGRWVYLYGTRYPRLEHVRHSMQWYDTEPEHLYTRALHWHFDIGEVVDGPYFLTDEEAGRPTSDTDNSDPEC